MTGQQNRYWKLVVFVSEGYGNSGMQYWNRFKRIREWRKVMDAIYEAVTYRSYR
jgi:hypothetical protein